MRPAVGTMSSRAARCVATPRRIQVARGGDAMKYFGTDGFRGRANEGLTVEHAYRIGRFVGWYYGIHRGRKARVVLGKDTRRSSYMF